MKKRALFLAMMTMPFCITSCGSKTKTLSQLFRLKANDVTNLAIINNPAKQTYEIEPEKKDVFLEKLFNIKVTLSEPCDCMGLHNIVFDAKNNNYVINQYYSNAGKKHYNFHVGEEYGIESLIDDYLNGRLQLLDNFFEVIW